MTITTDQIAQHVLIAYPMDIQAEDIAPIDPSAALGSCKHWKIDSPDGQFCLRCRSKSETTQNRLQFAQAVTWTAAYEGLDFVPLPIETVEHKGFIEFNDCYWELLPWFETTVFDEKQAEQKNFQIVSAMMSLAQFHLSVADFPLPNYPVSVSLCIRSILSKWENWQSERFGQFSRLGLLHQVLEQYGQQDGSSTEIRLAKTGRHFVNQISPLIGNITELLARAVRFAVPVQPVIGNAVLRHVCFDTDGVCGMIDFKEIVADSVSRDVASLLGSIAEANVSLWGLGLKAYQSIRPLSQSELFLVRAFDRTLPILEALDYLSAVFLDEKPFGNLQRTEILRRVESLVLRLEDEKRRKNIA